MRPLAAPGPHPNPLPSNGRGGCLWRMSVLLRWGYGGGLVGRTDREPPLRPAGWIVGQEWVCWWFGWCAPRRPGHTPLCCRSSGLRLLASLSLCERGDCSWADRFLVVWLVGLPLSPVLPHPSPLPQRRPLQNSRHSRGRGNPESIKHAFSPHPGDNHRPFRSQEMYESLTRNHWRSAARVLQWSRREERGLLVAIGRGGLVGESATEVGFG